ncbi:uncharacterized protein LOC101166416 isoform X2 [Oryzias latipes]|uniref:uncharacterized protein LOC101166416 isoform X2 n=1 Tax=Oryzias latipes TaxID=8090 RepID=UPI000CE163F4|nr:uncharacterized protein LOC101166416 isoform X2 [Oryzias latipes]
MFPVAVNAPQATESPLSCAVCPQMSAELFHFHKKGELTSRSSDSPTFKRKAGRKAAYGEPRRSKRTNQSQETELGPWRREPEETKWPNSEDLQRVLLRVARKPKLCRCFTGQTGRKPTSKTQTAGKRIGHTFHTFVGLMGKRENDQGASRVR